MNLNRLSRRRLAARLLVITFSTIVFLPILAAQYNAKVYFHQFALQKHDLRRHSIFSGASFEYYHSLHCFGRAMLFSRTSKPTSIGNPEAIFDFIFSCLPRVSYVIPTEQLHYFQATIADENVAGNIRTADLNTGSLSMVYYPIARPHEVRAFKVSGATTPGLTISSCTGGFIVDYKGRAVQFRVPAEMHVHTDSGFLTDAERAIGLVVDESGQRFLLIYNSKMESFYYLVAPEYGIGEASVELSRDLHKGLRTGFIYYQPRGSSRFVLVGVNRESIESNTYFDGPGDQVPIHLKIRDLLRVAYPGSQLQGGVDEYGVMLKSGEWARYAICPYQRYSTHEDLVRLINSAGALSEVEVDTASNAMTREPWNNTAWREYVNQRLLEENASSELGASQ